MTKPLALLIPGLDGTGLLYYRQVPGLEEEYRVLPYRFRSRARFDYQDLVRELQTAVGPEPPGSVTVVGESFGGTVAMHYVLAHQERVSRLVLINTFSRYTRRLRIHLGCRLAPALQWGGVRRLKDFVVDRTLAHEGIPLEDRQRYREIILQVHLAAYVRRLELVREVDLRPRLAEILVPTLIFASGRDKLVPSVYEARLMSAHIAGARLFEFPLAGHALILTPGFTLSKFLGTVTGTVTEIP